MNLSNSSIQDRRDLFSYDLGIIGETGEGCEGVETGDGGIGVVPLDVGFIWIADGDKAIGWVFCEFRSSTSSNEGGTNLFILVEK